MKAMEVLLNPKIKLGEETMNREKERNSRKLSESLAPMNGNIGIATAENRSRGLLSLIGTGESTPDVPAQVG